MANGIYGSPKKVKIYNLLEKINIKYIYGGFSQKDDFQ